MDTSNSLPQSPEHFQTLIITSKIWWQKETKVAVRLNVTGTHKGEFQGIPPTGRNLSLDEMAFLTISDGKITEGWITSDTMSFMQQIGAVPADADARASGGSSSKNNN
jgi:predicted ester cyclase